MPFWESVNEFLVTPLGKAVIGLPTFGFGVVAGWQFRSWFGKKRLRLAKEEIESLEERLEEEKGVSRRFRREAEGKQPEIERLRAEIEAGQAKLADEQSRTADFRKRMAPFYHGYQKLKPLAKQLEEDLATVRTERDHLAAGLAGSDAELAKVREDVEARRAELDGIDNRIDRALRLEGSLWSARPLRQKVRRFIPLAERGGPIISVLNLKGGVGKTTITGQLGVALARRGYRVLLIDLDLQGSLSQMLLGYGELVRRDGEKLLMHHFLGAVVAEPTRKIHHYAADVPLMTGTPGRLSVVAASDRLAYAELSLTLRWLLRRGDRDTRFLLRRALQLKGLRQHYDIILLDCPPLMNVSCINALAASDYLLVPTMFGQQAVDRVPQLLGRFLRSEEFVQHINPGLRVLGLVANRTQRGELTAAERGVWDRLAASCKDVFLQDVKRFRTTIPELTVDLRDAEAIGGIPPSDGKLATVFGALAAELEQELPNDYRRPAKALS